MAGWKLRKDKTPAETPGAEAEAAAPAETREESIQQESDPHESGQHTEAALPSFDSGPESFTDLEFDSDDEPKAAGKDHGDGPLTLVDYTEPDTEYSPFGSAPHHAQVFEMPAPIEMDPPAFEPAPVFEPTPIIAALPPMTEPVSPSVIPTLEDDFQERLRTGRFEAGELAPPPPGGFSTSGASAFGIPSVSPFVLDTAPPAPPPAAPAQLIVHIGRLSAPFDVTKDVTTIGRPDSALHYYPDVEVEMDDAVSRRHAEVVKRGDGYYLVDTGSTNGTQLNGALLPAHEEHLLAHGDRIRVGEITEIVFE